MFKNLEFLSTSTNQPLFHYTEIEGMEGILKNNTIWLTHFKCLNDREELNHIITLYKKIAEKECRDEAFKQYIIELIQNGEHELENNSEGIYILSLTMDNNSECMWKKYANGGVNIKFGTPADFGLFFHHVQHRLVDINNELHETKAIGFFGKVYYSDDEIEKMIHDIYISKSKKTTYNENFDIEFMKTFLKNNYIRFFKKSENWSYEKEYRLVIILNNEENEKFRHFRDNCRPYIKLSFSANILLLNGININSGLVYSAKKEVVVDIMKKAKKLFIPLNDIGHASVTDTAFP